jgi:hypothetical protein
MAISGIKGWALVYPGLERGTDAGELSNELVLPEKETTTTKTSGVELKFD